jgi:leucyl-tRNA synthetase
MIIRGVTVVKTQKKGSAQRSEPNVYPTSACRSSGSNRGSCCTSMDRTRSGLHIACKLVVCVLFAAEAAAFCSPAARTAQHSSAMLSVAYRRGLSTLRPLVAAAAGRSSSRCHRRSWTQMSQTAGATTTAAPVPPPKYDHKTIEDKWQAYWDEHNTFATPVRDQSKPKKYVLDMFPYPSGSGLHVGHPEGYTASDVMARYWRMTGCDVLHPMGWDSFGLPAEQHAIQTGTHPADTTYRNIATFKRQLKSLGFSYDWGRELATTDPGFVRWTQWIFLQLFKAGLAEQSEALVNWCPALGTVLANEEIINGLSERGDHPVVRQPLRQWVLKITKYADQLEAGLQGLQWPEGTLTAQRQWIGRSEGASITFGLPGSASVDVFTTRPDTLMGVTYLVLAPEHPLVASLTAPQQVAAVQAYVATTAGKSDLARAAAAGSKTKTGVPLGVSATHPLSGEAVPVWIADYVLGSYGTGAVMAVPAHDERDLAFARAFSLPVRRVVGASADAGAAPIDEEAFTAAGVAVNSGPPFDGLTTAECAKAVVAALAEQGAGAAVTNYKLRDWIFSRQRYWGEPIPIYFPVDMQDASGDPRTGSAHTIRYDQPRPVPDSELPLTLPEMASFEPGDDPAGCLARAADWRYFQREGQWFARETNTMPQWAGSCWYYLRFADPSNSQAAWGAQADKDWLPVDLYVGGQEHAVLHLLYARFWHRVLHDLGFAKDAEPFARLVHQGMILGADGEKMSKSRGNVVNPDDITAEYGADALRLYEMFMGPLEATKPWQTAQVSYYIISSLR